jgi:hypothetical protein
MRDLKMRRFENLKMAIMNCCDREIGLKLESNR